MLNLRRYFVYSFAAHLFFFFAALMLIPSQKGLREREEFFARLVSPDELFSGKQTVHPPVMMPPVRMPQSSPRFGKDHKPSESTSRKEPPPPAIARDAIPGQDNTPSKKGEVVKNQMQAYSGKDKLFDRGIIGDMAKKNLEKEEQEKREKTFSFDTAEYRYLIYNQRLKQRIESIWAYPRDAAAKGIYGDLIIRFTILQNGNLGAAELVRTSGHKGLDDAALKALRDGAPYWPLPKDWGLDAYTIEGLFIYTLYGYYIM